MARDFYCVFHGHGTAWEALCLDLDLAVTGRSLNEVRTLMLEAVETYVADAMKESEPARSALLHRRAPLRVRAYWAARFAWAALRGIDDDKDVPFGQPVSCHG
jgi:hypothetical protein